MDIKGIGAIRVKCRQRHTQPQEHVIRSFNQLTVTTGFIFRARARITSQSAVGTFAQATSSTVATERFVTGQSLGGRRPFKRLSAHVGGLYHDAEYAPRKKSPKACYRYRELVVCGCAVLRYHQTTTSELRALGSCVTRPHAPSRFKYFDVAPGTPTSPGGVVTRRERDGTVTPLRFPENTRLSTSIICFSYSQSFLGCISAMVQNKLQGVYRGFLIYIRVRQDVVLGTYRVNS